MNAVKVTSYKSLAASAVDRLRAAVGQPLTRRFSAPSGCNFPVVFSQARSCRPFLNYPEYTKDDCPLCARIREGVTSTAVVSGMEWLPANFPIKPLHAIVYPREHRASMLVSDICYLGHFIDQAGDVIAGINFRGAAASIWNHFHAQLHDLDLCPADDGELHGSDVFPILGCPTDPIAGHTSLRLFRVGSYPAFCMVLEGPWPLLGAWMITYTAASNNRPTNFALASGPKLYIIPRGLERAPDSENSFGASEMLGLISPITRAAFDSIVSGEFIDTVLRACGLTAEAEIRAALEHARWVTEHTGADGGTCAV